MQHLTTLAIKDPDSERTMGQTAAFGLLPQQRSDLTLSGCAAEYTFARTLTVALAFGMDHLRYLVFWRIGRGARADIACDRHGGVAKDA